MRPTGMTEPVLGVLGGMGPAATADFLARLASLTPASCDQEHLATIVYSDPRTADRSDAILGHGPSPLPAMIRGVDFLNQAGCGLIAIPCNTAHHWYADLAARSRAPVLHIAAATIARLRAHPGIDAVGLLATDGTVRAAIYHTRLQQRGIAVLDLADRSGANHVMRGIRAMKAGQADAAREDLVTAGSHLARQGAKALIVACTDISTALSGVTAIDGRPVVDASDCLALAALERFERFARHRAPTLEPDRSMPARAVDAFQ